MKHSLLIETDILVEFLTSEEKNSSLRKILSTHRCYTTFVQMTELLSCARSEQEREAMIKLFIGVRVLGFHNRYSIKAAQMLAEMRELSQEKNFSSDNVFRCALVAAVASESKLPVYTKKFFDNYRNFSAIATIEEF